MILTGAQIQREIESGSISIDPYRPEQLNPASYDLRLGSKVKFYKDKTQIDVRRPSTMEMEEVTIGPRGYVLRPQIGYLLHVEETVCAKNHVGVIDGKSTLARLFLLVHFTAGYVDPGFCGQYTLEAMVMHPLVVYHGMRIAQVRFHTCQGEVTTYNGHYVGSTAMGPVAPIVDSLLNRDG